MEARAIRIVQTVRVVHDLYSDLGAVREVYRLVHDDPALCDVRPKRQGHGVMLAGIRGGEVTSMVAGRRRRTAGADPAGGAAAGVPGAERGGALRGSVGSRTAVTQCVGGGVEAGGCATYGAHAGLIHARGCASWSGRTLWASRSEHPARATLGSSSSMKESRRVPKFWHAEFEDLGLRALHIMGMSAILPCSRGMALALRNSHNFKELRPARPRGPDVVCHLHAVLRV